MFRQIDERMLVSGQIQPSDVQAAADAGVTMIVNNRPDGEQPGQPAGTEIEAAARAAGLDLGKAKAAIASGKYASEVENNGRMADAVGFSGTPAWVIGSEAFSGAMGRDALSQAIERARGGQP